MILNVSVSAFLLPQPLQSCPRRNILVRSPVAIDPDNQYHHRQDYLGYLLQAPIDFEDDIVAVTMDNLQSSELQNQRLIIAVVTTCITLAAGSFALRFYSPIRQGGSRYWFGDYWMACVLLLCLGMSVSEYIGEQPLI